MEHERHGPRPAPVSAHAHAHTGDTGCSRKKLGLGYSKNKSKTGDKLSTKAKPSKKKRVDGRRVLRASYDGGWTCPAEHGGHCSPGRVGSSKTPNRLPGLEQSANPSFRRDLWPRASPGVTHLRLRGLRHPRCPHHPRVRRKLHTFLIQSQTNRTSVFK